MLNRRTTLAGAAAAMASATTARAQGDAPALLVMEKNAGTLGFLDPESGRRLGEVALAEYPHEFVVDPQSRLAFVGHYGVETSAATAEGGHAVLVVDLRERKIAHRIDIAPFNRPHGMAIDARGRLSVLSEGRNTLLTFDEPAEARQPSIAVAAGGIKTHLFALTRDGERAYVTGLLSNTASLVRPRDAAIAPVTVTTGRMPEGLCLSPDERTLYVANRRSGTVAAIAADSMRVTETRPVSGDPLRLYALPDGRLLLADLERARMVLLGPRLEEIAAIPLDAKPSAASLHPSRPLAFVSLANDRIALLDLETHRIEGHFATRAGADVTRLVTPG
ncbi:YncE family protein [Roseomonas sp. OT10]|uniref:YncE family protein n=1 Tax=Roseomonas cutis TaxID=2897332 RepID=UPI001E3D4B10|nr:YncE family protein [Roseomonas sp. OT10]UFN48702.1 YncE family protein [Roseomonas sp. OT10]